MRHPLFSYLNQIARERWVWQCTRTLLRSLWIAACIWCIGLGGHVLWGWTLRPRLLTLLSLEVLGIALLMALLRRRLTPREVARRLDRRFKLKEQLSTAVEVAVTNPPPGSVSAYLLNRSGRLAAHAHTYLRRQQRPPWTEVLTLVAFVLLLAGFALLAGIGRPDLPASSLPLPPLVSAPAPADLFAGDPSAPGEQEVLRPGAGGEQAREREFGALGGSGDPRVLETLADALRDHGATRPAAEALDRGDVSGAAEELRELADQAGQLSEQSREDLASSLRDAADRIEQSDPDLAEQLRRSADGLSRGGRDASQALDDLAQALEDLQEGGGDRAEAGESAGAQTDPEGGQSGLPGGANGAGDQPGGEQRQSDPSERLGIDGLPVELEVSGQGRVPADPTDRPPTGSETAPGFTQGETSSDDRVRTGADPLRVPLEERDVVQGYFTP
ncbi:MAG: hypothetical protein KatS3mg057_1992 [Herpetosiphonaceae bacterium]|nr:MAG: hypothetical protein KatS3mg057_1992 [Herpetosiphonaceae bacterium]